MFTSDVLSSMRNPSKYISKEVDAFYSVNKLLYRTYRIFTLVSIDPFSHNVAFSLLQRIKSPRSLQSPFIEFLITM